MHALLAKEEHGYVLSELEMTRRCETSRPILLCMPPGTDCSPLVFECLDKTAFPQALLRRRFYRQPAAALLEQLRAYASMDGPARSSAAARASLDPTAVLPQRSIPAVVVHGRYDQARPVAHAEWPVEHLPHAEFLCILAGIPF